MAGMPPLSSDMPERHLALLQSTAERIRQAGRARLALVETPWIDSFLPSLQTDSWRKDETLYQSRMAAWSKENGVPWITTPSHFQASPHWHPSGLNGETRAKLANILAEEDFPMNVTFGDGSPVPESDLELVRTIVREETTQFTWQKGDVLLCDNFLISHDRRSFTGERKVYVALG